MEDKKITPADIVWSWFDAGGPLGSYDDSELCLVKNYDGFSVGDEVTVTRPNEIIGPGFAIVYCKGWVAAIGKGAKKLDGTPFTPIVVARDNGTVHWTNTEELSANALADINDLPPQPKPLFRG